jgi:hypothetical protein
VDPISVSTPIDAPREPVFDFLVDLANRPAILGDFVSEYRLQRLDSAGVGAAARFRITESGLWMESVIEEADRPHRIAERGRAGRLGRIAIATVWELTVDEGEGCVARLTYWTEPPSRSERAIEKLTATERFYRHQWSRALGRLKQVIESGERVERVRVAGGDRIPGAG